MPGFRPSARAYAPAVAVLEGTQGLLRRMVDDGTLRADLDLDRAFRSWTAVISGVLTQQLSNAPTEPFETGRFTSTLPDVMEMWLRFHAAAGRG